MNNAGRVFFIFFFLFMGGKKLEKACGVDVWDILQCNKLCWFLLHISYKDKL